MSFQILSHRSMGAEPVNLLCRLSATRCRKCLRLTFPKMQVLCAATSKPGGRDRLFVDAQVGSAPAWVEVMRRSVMRRFRECR